MPRRCTICAHDDREAIEEAIVTRPVTRVAAEYGVSQDAIYHHRDSCIKDAFAEIVKAEKVSTGMRLIDRIVRLDELVEGVVARSLNPDPVVMRDGRGNPMIDPDTHEPLEFTPPINDGMVLRAVREARENAALVAKVIGDLPPENQVEAARKALDSPNASRIAAELEELLAEEDERREAEQTRSRS